MGDVQQGTNYVLKLSTHPPTKVTIGKITQEVSRRRKLPPQSDFANLLLLHEWPCLSKNVNNKFSSSLRLYCVTNNLKNYQTVSRCVICQRFIRTKMGRETWNCTNWVQIRSHEIHFISTLLPVSGDTGIIFKRVEKCQRPPFLHHNEWPCFYPLVWIDFALFTFWGQM